MIVFVEKTVGKIFVAASKKEIIARSSRRISPGTAAAFFFSQYCDFQILLVLL